MTEEIKKVDSARQMNWQGLTSQLGENAKKRVEQVVVESYDDKLLGIRTLIESGYEDPSKFHAAFEASKNRLSEDLSSAGKDTYSLQAIPDNLLIATEPLGQTYEHGYGQSALDKGIDGVSFLMDIVGGLEIKDKEGFKGVVHTIEGPLTFENLTENRSKEEIVGTLLGQLSALTQHTLKTLASEENAQRALTPTEWRTLGTAVATITPVRTVVAVYPEVGQILEKMVMIEGGLTDSIESVNEVLQDKQNHSLLKRVGFQLNPETVKLRQSDPDTFLRKVKDVAEESVSTRINDFISPIKEAANNPLFPEKTV